MKRKGPRLSVDAISVLIKAGASDEAIMDHYRELHFDIRVVALTIRRCKIKLKMMKPREAVVSSQEWKAAWINERPTKAGGLTLSEKKCR